MKLRIKELNKHNFYGNMVMKPKVFSEFFHSDDSKLLSRSVYARFEAKKKRLANSPFGGNILRDPVELYRRTPNVNR